jgi:GNAT superfamily N-acetyltransferase
MPEVEVEGIGTIEFPEGMTREQMEAAILDNFGEQIAQIKSDRRQRDFARQQEVATKNQKEKGFGASFLDGMAQTEEDFALGTALLDLNHDDAKTLLEQEYQQWLDSPAAQDDPSFFSARGAGKLTGEVLPNIVATVGAAFAATTVSTPIGGLIAGGATAAGISGVTTKGATFRNDYYSLRQKGVDPAEAYETARDTSNKSAAISAGIAGVTATVPIGKAVSPASTPVRTAVKVAGTEAAFDAGLGGVESVASDLYAESQGVERGDIVENALRSMTAEALVGAPFAGAQTVSAYRKSRADRFVADRTAPPTQRALPAPPERLGLPYNEPVALIGTDPLYDPTAGIPRLTGPDLTAPSRYLPGPDAVPPMILGGPIIDVDSGKVIDAAEISNVPTALLDERGNVIDLGDQNDAGRTAALDIENLFSDRVSNKRVDPESGKLGFRRTAEDFVDVKPRDPDVDAPTPKPKRELTQTTKPEPPTTRTFQEGYEDIFRTFKVTQEAADFYNQGATETTITSPQGRIKIASGVDNSPNKNSVVDFVVSEDKRGQGHGKALMAKAMEMFPELGGQVSSLSALKIAYDAGRRPATKPEATWEQTKKIYEDSSPESGGSINMKTPERPDLPKPQMDKGQQLLFEFKEAVQDLGSRVSSGVDPIATWKAFKSLVKMASYHAANGVKSAAEFAKRIGTKLNAAVKQAWEDATGKVARSPKDVSQAVLNALTGVGEKTRITETVKVLGNSVDEKLTLLRKRLNLQDRDSTATKAIRGLVDRFVDLKMLQRTIAAGKKIPDTMNAYLRMEHLQDRVGYLRKQVDEKVMEPFLADMKRLNITPDEIHLYLHARHAEEANGRIAEVNPDMPDGGSGMTNKQAADLLEDFAEKGQIPALEQLEKQIRALLQSKLDMEFEGGLIDQDNYDRLSTYYKNYVPLNREAHDDHLTKGNSVKQSNVFRGHKARKGSSKEVVDILSNVFFQYYNTIQQVERNRVMATLGEMVKEFKNDVVFPTGKPTLADQAQTVSYRVAGQERHLRVTNPYLAANLNNIQGGSLHPIIQALSAGNRYLSLINTQLAPSFVIPNFLRDLQTAKINLMGEQAEALRKNVIRGARKAFKATWKAEVGTKGKKSYEGEYGQYYKEFSEIGGKIEFFGLQDFERFKKDLDTKFKRGKTKAALDKLRQRAGDINAAVENTMRLSVYVNARKAGVSKLQASSLAKNITVNFSRKGEWSKGLNSWFLFFNAGVQGSYRMAQAIRSKKVQKTVAQIAAFAAAQDIFNNLVSGEDEDGETFYKKIPEHERERNMIIMNPLGEGRLTIPMPYGFNVFHYFGTNMSRMLRGEISVWDNLGHTTSSVLNAFNPIGGASDILSLQGLARAATPDVLDFGTQIVTNKDWKDDPVLPDRNPYDKYDEPDSQRYFGNVSEPSKAITRKLNELFGGSTVRSSGITDVSPETVDHVFAHFFGSMGKDLESVSNLFSGEWGRLPVVKRFVGGQTIYYDQENYYKLRGEAYQADDQIKAYRQEGEVKKLREYAEEAAPLRRILPRIKETDKQIKEINQRMRRIEASQSMSDSVKEEQLEKLKERKIQLMKLTRKRFLTLTGNE